MKDKTVAILESRVRDHIASLVRKYGGTPFSAPALAEIPDVDPAHIKELIRDWNSAPPDIFVFQTGVGTRALFAATDSLGLTNDLLRLLDSAQVVVRGPKPTTVLHSRKVRIDRAASNPFTTQEVLAEMHESPLRGKRVVVQRYGETNRDLQVRLESEGAEVIEIVTYRWGLPEDTAPLLRLIDALGRDEIDLVAFTTASQASNLFAVAQYDGKEASLKQSLGRTLVASIGPVCSAALRKLAVRVDIEAHRRNSGRFWTRSTRRCPTRVDWANPNAWGWRRDIPKSDTSIGLNIREIDVRVAFRKRDGPRRVLAAFGKAFLNLAQLFRPDRGINRGGEVEVYGKTSTHMRSSRDPNSGSDQHSSTNWRSVGPCGTPHPAL
jgi:uroporphyrinogen-III synthase